MDEVQAMEHLRSARHAYLATADADGRPHVVPVVFVVSEGRLATAVDQKPKRKSRLKRHSNIEANSRVAVLADHYSDDWDQLWWVRADGDATIAEAREERSWIEMLQAKYAQYRDMPPHGPIIVVAIDRITGWSGAVPPT